MPNLNAKQLTIDALLYHHGRLSNAFERFDKAINEIMRAVEDDVPVESESFERLHIMIEQARASLLGLEAVLPPSMIENKEFQAMQAAYRAAVFGPNHDLPAMLAGASTSSPAQHNETGKRGSR